MKVQRKAKKNKQSNSEVNNGMQWNKCLICKSDKIKHGRGQKANVKLFFCRTAHAKWFEIFDDRSNFSDHHFL